MTTAASAPLIEAEGLSKTFSGSGLIRRGPDVKAVQGVDAMVARGEAVGVVGESGSGKSTLGRLMLGLIPASEGSIRFDATEVGALKGRALSEWRARCAMMFQQFNLLAMR